MTSNCSTYELINNSWVIINKGYSKNNDKLLTSKFKLTDCHDENSFKTKHNNKTFSPNEWKAFTLNKSNIKQETNLYVRYLYSLRKGIEPIIRPFIWCNLSQINKLSKSYSKDFYFSLLTQNDTENELLIKKDIDRTYFNLNDINLYSTSLFNILKAYAIFDYEVGYCQGMNFIVLQILSVMHNEELSFWMFFYIMQVKKWRSNFLENTPSLILHILNLKSRIISSLPRLYFHLKKEDIIEKLYGIFSPIYTTIFSYRVSGEYSLRIWDLFIEYGSSIITESIISMLQHNEDELLRFSHDVSC